MPREEFARSLHYTLLLCHARGHQLLPALAFSSLTCDLRQRSLTLSHMTYGTPCHARGHLHSHMWLNGTPCHARGHLHTRTKCFPPQFLTSSLGLPWAITRFLDPFYTFSPAHRRVIHNFALTPYLGKQRNYSNFWIGTPKL